MIILIIGKVKRYIGGQYDCRKCDYPLGIIDGL